MGLGEVISKSYKEYLKGFRLNFKSFFWLFAIPYAFLFVSLFLISNFLGLPLIGTDMNNISDIDFSGVNLGLLIGLVSLVFLIYMVFMMFFYITLYYSAFNSKGSMTFSQAFMGGKKYFWRFLGIGVVSFLLFVVPFVFLIPAIIVANSVVALTVILGLLFFAGLVVAFIIAVYWIMGPWVLFDKNSKVMDCLRTSMALVKGNWWKTIGYMIIMMLISMGISLVSSIPIAILDQIGKQLSGSVALTIISVLNRIIGLIATLISVPFSIIYLKNYYLSLKK